MGRNKRTRHQRRHVDRHFDVYDVTKWSQRHPGGDQLLIDLAGEDAPLSLCQDGCLLNLNIIVKRLIIESYSNYKCNSGLKFE